MECSRCQEQEARIKYLENECKIQQERIQQLVKENDVRECAKLIGRINCSLSKAESLAEKYGAFIRVAGYRVKGQQELHALGLCDDYVTARINVYIEIEKPLNCEFLKQNHRGAEVLSKHSSPIAPCPFTD